MSKFKDWIKLRNELERAKSFQSNESKTNSQDNMYYKPIPSANTQTIRYCGQAYAGANNYHECDESFAPYIGKAIKKLHRELISTAIELMQKDVDALSEKAKDEVEQLAIECGLINKKGINHE